MDKKIHTLISASTGLMLNALDNLPLSAPVYRKPKRPCLQCGKPHNHNNSWCSADCCKKYRSEQQNTGECNE